MWLKEGTTVVTANDEKAGVIDRIVIDPRTKEVTHLVVRKGFLFTEDRVIPMEAVASSSEDQVVLRADIENLDDFPPFEETEFVDVDETDFARERPDMGGDIPYMYWYPSVAGAPLYGPRFLAVRPDADQPGYRTQTERNIPDNTVALQKGAPVISADGKHVGDLERVLVGKESDLATHFVVSKGILFTEKKLVPVSWIRDIEEEQVRLGVNARQIERLPDFEKD